MEQTARAGAGASSTAVAGEWSLAAQQPVPQPALYDGAAWRDAAVAWLVQRLVLLALTYLLLWYRISLTRASPPSSTVSQLLQVWTTWDGAHYAAIAEGGYTQLQQTAFFPLYPLLERMLAPLFGGNPALAGLAIANAACLVAYALLRVLAEREYGRSVARQTLLYLAIFPYSLFLAAAYTEALFLALSLGVFLALRGHHWKLAGVLAALATLTRPVGILLLVPVVYVYSISWFRSAGEKRFQLKVTDILALLLPIVALAGFDLALAAHFRILVPASAAEASGWGRRLSWPWEGIIWASSALLHVPIGVRLYVALDIFWTLLFAALALATLWPLGLFGSQSGSMRRLPLAYGLYAVASALLMLVTPVYNPEEHYGGALVSSGRYMLVVFPLFLLLARAGYSRPAVHRVVFTTSLVLSAFVVMLFVGGIYVG
ncbi:MAG: mannosyltransferase family protein [Ktedonobacterales bacterium]